jgi:amino-acid N-acetyltransferase
VRPETTGTLETMLAPCTPAEILQLLSSAGLPTVDLTGARDLQRGVFEDDRLILGVIGLERFGTDALLRSLAVTPQYRRRGAGRELVRLEHEAQANGIRRLVLLTETAEVFFADMGYVVTDRGGVSDGVQQSAEFRSLCPASAVCMVKALPFKGS